MAEELREKIARKLMQYDGLNDDFYYDNRDSTSDLPIANISDLPIASIVEIYENKANEFIVLIKDAGWKSPEEIREITTKFASRLSDKHKREVDEAYKDAGYHLPVELKVLGDNYFFNIHYNRTKREELMDTTMGSLNSDIDKIIEKYVPPLWDGEVYQVLISLAETYRSRMLNGGVELKRTDKSVDIEEEPKWEKEYRIERARRDKDDARRFYPDGRSRPFPEE